VFPNSFGKMPFFHQYPHTGKREKAQSVFKLMEIGKALSEIFSLDVASSFLHLHEKKRAIVVKITNMTECKDLFQSTQAHTTQN
jgi:hypothetical protein